MAAPALPLGGPAAATLTGLPGFHYGHTATFSVGKLGDAVDLQTRLYTKDSTTPSPHWDVSAKRFAHVLRYSQCGGIIFGGCNDGTVLAWDSDTLSLVWAAYAHDGPVISVASDGVARVVVTTGADCTVRVWCIDTAQCVASLHLPSLPLGASLSPLAPHPVAETKGPTGVEPSARRRPGPPSIAVVILLAGSAPLLWTPATGRTVSLPAVTSELSPSPSISSAAEPGSTLHKELETSLSSLRKRAAAKSQGSAPSEAGTSVAWGSVTTGSSSDGIGERSVPCYVGTARGRVLVYRLSVGSHGAAPSSGGVSAALVRVVALPSSASVRSLHVLSVPDILSGSRGRVSSVPGLVSHADVVSEYERRASAVVPAYGSDSNSDSSSGSSDEGGVRPSEVLLVGTHQKLGLVIIDPWASAVLAVDTAGSVIEFLPQHAGQPAGGNGDSGAPPGDGEDAIGLGRRRGGGSGGARGGRGGRRSVIASTETAPLPRHSATLEALQGATEPVAVHRFVTLPSLATPDGATVVCHAAVLCVLPPAETHPPNPAADGYGSLCVGGRGAEIIAAGEKRGKKLRVLLWTREPPVDHVTASGTIEGPEVSAYLATSSRAGAAASDLPSRGDGLLRRIRPHAALAASSPLHRLLSALLQYRTLPRGTIAYALDGPTDGTAAVACAPGRHALAVSSRGGRIVTAHRLQPTSWGTYVPFLLPTPEMMSNRPYVFDSERDSGALSAAQAQALQQDQQQQQQLQAQPAGTVVSETFAIDVPAVTAADETAPSIEAPAPVVSPPLEAAPVPALGVASLLDSSSPVVDGSSAAPGGSSSGQGAATIVDEELELDLVGHGPVAGASHVPPQPVSAAPRPVYGGVGAAGRLLPKRSDRGIPIGSFTPFSIALPPAAKPGKPAAKGGKAGVGLSVEDAESQSLFTAWRGVAEKALGFSGSDSQASLVMTSSTAFLEAPAPNGASVSGSGSSDSDSEPDADAAAAAAASKGSLEDSAALAASAALSSPGAYVAALVYHGVQGIVSVTQRDVPVYYLPQAPGSSSSASAASGAQSSSASSTQGAGASRAARKRAEEAHAPGDADGAAPAPEPAPAAVPSGRRAAAAAAMRGFSAVASGGIEEDDLEAAAPAPSRRGGRGGKRGRVSFADGGSGRGGGRGRGGRPSKAARLSAAASGTYGEQGLAQGGDGGDDDGAPAYPQHRNDDGGGMLDGAGDDDAPLDPQAAAEARAASRAQAAEARERRRQESAAAAQEAASARVHAAERVAAHRAREADERAANENFQAQLRQQQLAAAASAASSASSGSGFGGASNPWG